jgi:trimeric autotransporter adhesin
MKKTILLITSLFLVMFLKAQNTNYGFDAGYSGNYNTNLGYMAGDTTTGTWNTFVGYMAGLTNTSGYSNNFFGYKSGTANSIGYHNSFYGYGTGSKQTSGNFNSFFGNYSGNSNISGNNNTYMGANSGVMNVSGSNNAFLGSSAGYSNTGSNNTFLGLAAGYLNTGSNNVFLGYNAGYNETGSNKLYIDNSLTDSPLIYGDFSTDIVNINGKLGIGTSSTPTEKLEVAGNIKATKFIGEGASQWTTSASNIYYNTGNVGIGTDAPSNTQGWNRVLDIRGDLASKILTTTANADVKTGMYAHTSWHDGGGFIGTESSHPLYLIAGYDPKMAILTNGNVGIGTATPREALHVKGSIFLEGTTTSPIDGSMENYFYWRGHHLIFGTEKGDYAHNVIEIKPGGASNGPLFSMLAMYTATGIGQNTQKVQIHTDGVSYFNGGNVLIGKTTQANSNYKLDVEGAIRANEVVVNTTGADFVFSPSYRLRPLSEVESFIKQNQHLPEVASASEMKSNGVSLSELQTTLLQKVEELTLYSIEQKKVIDELKQIVKVQNEKIEKLESVGK